MKLGITIFLLSFSILLMAQEEINTFRGWEWGLNYDQVADQLEPSDSRTTRGFKPFTKVEDDLLFEGLQADNILYLFKRDKLVAGTVALHNEKLDQILTIFTQKYGEPKKVDAFVLTNYEWHLESATLVVTHIPAASNEIGVSVQIEGK